MSLSDLLPLLAPLSLVALVALLALVAVGWILVVRRPSRGVDRCVVMPTPQDRLQDPHATAGPSAGLTDLAGGIAHAFNNHLMVISGNAERLMRTLGSDAPQAAPLKRILEASSRATDLTQQLLAFAGGVQRVPRPLDLNAQVRDLAEELGRALPERVELELECMEDTATVEADPDLLRQALGQLVRNAGEAAGQAGPVSLRTAVVRTDHSPPSGIWSRPLGPGRWVLVEVRDRGPGPATLRPERLFEPFFSTKFQDRGLGLAAARGIAEAHGGALWVREPDGGGTAVALVLPARAKPGPAEDRAADARTEAEPGALILVVDDEQGVREVARDMLISLGHRVEEADSGRAALARLGADAEPIDLVLLDLTMPGMDGLTTMEAIHRLDPHRPVLLISGYAEETDQDLAARGAAGFLRKPFGLGDLKATVRAILAAVPQARA